MQNNDLISRAAAVRAVHEEFDECLVWDESGETTANAVENVLYLVQSVDAMPVRHGRWMTHEDDGWGDTYNQCSECGQEWYLECGTPEENGMKFCPNCGAKMDGDSE